jgi:hypothetical protein
MAVKHINYNPTCFGHNCLTIFKGSSFVLSAVTIFSARLHRLFGMWLECCLCVCVPDVLVCLFIYFIYLGTNVTNQNSIQEGSKCRLKPQNACYGLVQNLSSSSLLSKNIKIKVYRSTVFLLFSKGVKLGQNKKDRPNPTANPFSKLLHL